MTTRLHLKNWFIFNLFIFFVSCKNYYSATKNDVKKIRQDTISISLWFMGFSAIAQIGNRIDTIDYFKGCSYTGVINVDGKIIVDGWAIDTTLQFRLVNINSKIPLVGETAHNTSIVDTIYNGFATFYGNISKTYDGGYVSSIATAIKNKGGVMLCEYKADTIFRKVAFIDTISSKSYGPSLIVQHYIDSSYYLGGGMGTQGGGTSMFIFHYDKTLQLQKRMYYSVPGFPAFGGMAYRAGKLYLAARSQFAVSGSVTISRTYIIVSDTNGNVLQNKVETNTDAYSGNGFMATSDGGFIGVGDSAISRDSMWGGIDGQVGYIVKYDSLLNKQWVLALSVVYTNWATFYAVKEDNNGDFVVCGTTPFDGYENGWLVKVNKNGQLIWSKMYRAITDTFCGAANRLNALTVLPDNSIVACGETSTGTQCSPIPGITQYGWLIKVDSNGCMESGFCGYTGVEEVTLPAKPKITLYPNPTNGILHIEVDAPQSDRVVAIYDMLGRQVATEALHSGKTTINTKHWTTGVYFYQLLDKGRPVGSGKVIKE